MNDEDYNFDIDPLDDEIVEKVKNGMLGMRTTAMLLGTFRRELEKEGFAEEEIHEFCQTWLVEVLGEAGS